MLMYEVEIIFDGGETDVWMTESVLEAIEDHDAKINVRNTAGALLAKIKMWSQQGFRKFEGRHRDIKHEGQGVYRLGHRDLFRVYGFYEDDPKKGTFIALVAHAGKQKKRNTRKEQQKIDEVARARDNVDWRKVLDESEN